jgi:hypothetical protein
MKKSTPHSARPTSNAPAILPENSLPAGSTYWTLSFSPAVTTDQAAAFGVLPSNGYPHCLTRHQCGTAKELMEALAKVGRNPDQFTSSSDRFARVEITANGFTVTCFPSYSAALANDGEAGHPIRSDILPTCPFCRQSDRLETIDWSSERQDGTEYVGEAVRCNRCDAIAPVPAWLSHGKIHN